MQNRRRRRGFEHAGALPLDRLGLPRTRARELLLAQAWEEVAGSTLVTHARVVRVQRGLLEIEVSAGRWSATLSELLPGLTGRLARRYPELGVRRFRLIDRVTNGQGPIQPVAISGEAAIPEAPREASPAPQQRIEIEDQRAQGERLEELARSYVERRGDQNQ